MPTRTASPDEALSTYRAKRDFTRTSEPSGERPAPRPRAKRAKGIGRFVVQHHWARREHYDFRLELDGVLVSFAVTKGPSLDPSVKRLAVRTEDHPLAYAEFEGTIPKGEYGGGTVMVWDRGTWTPTEGDPHDGLDKGMLKFELDGERMKGGWALIRLKPEGKRENWLLIKERDEWADREADFTGAHLTSVTTGRSKEEIERAEEPTSFQGRSVEEAMAATAKSRSRKLERAAKRGPAPDFVPPMLCDVRKAAPDGNDWIHEIKYDGYRLQAAVSGSEIRLYTREGHDWAARFPSVTSALAALDIGPVLLDGEAVIFDEKGLTDFAALIAALDGRSTTICFVAFDILRDGKDDLARLPLLERKERLSRVLAGVDDRTLRIAGFVRGNGPAVFEKAVAGGAEGIVSKRADSAYRSGRGTAWAKVKADRRDDFVVIGYMPSDKRPFASLIAAKEVEGGLQFVGGIGTGFDTAELKRSRAKLDALRLDGPPEELLNPKDVQRKAVFVQPIHRVEVAFTGFTGAGHLRHPRFLGWREDRSQRKVAGRKFGREPVAPSKQRPAAREPGGASDGPVSAARITNPDRVMFPEAGVTKAELAAHYVAVADRMMPHLEGRPVSFVRAPEGLGAETFFQRHMLPGMKRGISRVRDPSGEHQDYMAIESPDGLVTAAQFGVVEIHGWGARLPDLDRPDRVVFDLDPDEDLPFERVREGAFEIRKLLEGVGLESFCMASGGKGLHVVAPLDASQDWDDIGDFTSGIARGLARSAPDRYVAVMAKKRRGGRIFIDWLRNRRSATAVMPWSLRAKPNATVAMPLDWDEVADLPAAGHFTIREAAARPDPWAGFFEVRQRIEPAALAFLKRFGRK